MKITKNKFAAASFGAALASLYSAPELCAQVDSDPTTGEFAFDIATVPFFQGLVTDNPGDLARINGLPTSIGYGVPIDFSFFNSSSYGFGVQGKNGVGAQFWLLEPGDVFDGSDGGGVNLFSLSALETGIRTIGFVANDNALGYFKVDLGQPGDAIVLLGGEVALSADGQQFNSDFVITVPDSNVAPLLGDVNLDGVVNFLDIAPFIDRLSTSTFQAEADIDQNGEVTFLDIQPFIQILSSGPSLQVSWSDSTGKSLDRFAPGNEALAKQIQAVEQELQKEINTAIVQTRGSDENSKPASIGLAALAKGADGLRRRRMAETAV